jgi:hypothetical protein
VVSAEELSGVRLAQEGYSRGRTPWVGRRGDYHRATDDRTVYILSEPITVAS